ncbi:MAG: hypothetical protein NVS1B11_33800 [Terriglobales bacterium]
MAIVAQGEIDASSAVPAANVQDPKTFPYLAEANAILDQIELGLPRCFISARKKSVMYVVTPKGSVDPRE